MGAEGRDRLEVPEMRAIGILLALGVADVCVLNLAVLPAAIGRATPALEVATPPAPARPAVAAPSRPEAPAPAPAPGLARTGLPPAARPLDTALPPAPAPEAAAIVNIIPIYFEPNLSRLDTSSRAAAGRAAARMLREPDLIVELHGYTDPTGPPEFNDELGERRAQFVAAHLKAAGVDATRIRAVGMGRTEDRRVDIVLRRERREK